MKNTQQIFATLLFGILVFPLACTYKSHASIAHRNEDNDKHKIDYDSIFADNTGFNESEVIDKKITIAEGTFVSVIGVDGSLDVQATDGNEAEIHIVRLAKTKAALQRQQPTFEYRKFKQTGDANFLEVRVDDGGKSHLSFIWDEIIGRDDLREHVTMKLPRNVNFDASAINGRVNVAAFDRMVNANSINGNVTIAKANGFAQFVGINGNLKANIAGIDKENGIRLLAINGDVELRFLTDVNAKINAEGVNGRITTDLPKVRVEKQEPENYQAVVGTGGPEIFISKMNGNVTLAPTQRAEIKKSTSFATSDQLAKVEKNNSSVK